MERFYKEQVETWRGDLELKHAQFEEARAQIMQPRELDTLRKQLMEEIETPARAKLHAYEAEIEEQTERYTQAVRDLETLRTAHDVEVARLLKDNEYQRMEHAQRASMMKRRRRLWRRRWTRKRETRRRWRRSCERWRSSKSAKRVVGERR